MSTLNGQWLPIFRAGDYGKKGVYTAAMLTALAAGYDPAKAEAPICIGHPTMDAPAFGWVKQLKVEGDTLMALPGEVNPALDVAVKAGAYKKRSVAFKRSSDGTLQLRHLGFLGAMPPHVEGLRDASFGDSDFQEIEFSDSSEGEDMNEEQVKKTVGDSIREFFASLGGPKQTTTITQADIETATSAATARIEAKFAAELEAERAARKQVETEFADHRKAVVVGSTNQRAQALIAGLKAKQRWIPAYDRMGVQAIFAALTANVTTEIEFSVAEGQTVKRDAATTFADFLEGLGQIVPQGAVFSAGKVEAPKTAPDGNGVEVDPASVTFNEQVQSYADENKLSFQDAYVALAKKGVRPVSGAASAGAV